MSIEARAGSFRVRLRRQGQAVSASFTTKVEAEAFEAAWIAAVVGGKEAPAPPRPEPVAVLVRPVTVEDACRAFSRGMKNGTIRTRSGKPYKASTTRGHENRLRLYVIPKIGAMPITAVRRGDVRRLVEEVAAEASPATAGNVRDALRLVFARAVYLEAIAENPAQGVRAPSAPPSRARFLTPQEADSLQAVADAYNYRGNAMVGPFVALALGTGARLGELRAVKWGAGGLDLDRRTLTISASLDRGIFVPPKSGEPRDVPLGADLIARMKRYRLASGRPEDGEPVFPRCHRRSWRNILKAAKLPGLRVHDLRHTAATFWLAAGLTVHAVADLLGHTDASLVLRLYGHALPAETTSAAERLEAWRESQRSSG